MFYVHVHHGLTTFCKIIVHLYIFVFTVSGNEWFTAALSEFNDSDTVKQVNFAATLLRELGNHADCAAT